MQSPGLPLMRELSAQLTEGLPYRGIDTIYTQTSRKFLLFFQQNQLFGVLRLHDNPSVPGCAVPPPFTQGRLWRGAQSPKAPSDEGAVSEAD